MGKDLSKYPKTGRFEVIDTIPVPHPYCITPKHLKYNTSMYLGRKQIAEAEKKGAVCDICRKRNKKFGDPILSIDEHKEALLIEVNDKRELKDVPGLHRYLLSIKEMTEKDGFVGFAFKQK